MTAIPSNRSFATLAPLPVPLKSIDQQGPRGGSLTGSIDHQGNKLLGSISLTTANGATTIASGTLTYKPGQATAQGSVTGPNGGTASGSVSVSQTADGVDIQASGTGPQGNTGSVDVTDTSGTVTITGGNGKSGTFHVVA